MLERIRRVLLIGAVAGGAGALATTMRAAKAQPRARAWAISFIWPARPGRT
jgi:hypothetical protein